MSCYKQAPNTNKAFDYNSSGITRRSAACLCSRLGVGPSHLASDSPQRNPVERTRLLADANALHYTNSKFHGSPTPASCPVERGTFSSSAKNALLFEALFEAVP